MNPKLKRLVIETGELEWQIMKLKARIRRRGEKLINPFDPLERLRIEIEIKLLENKVSNLMLNDLKSSLTIILE